MRWRVTFNGTSWGFSFGDEHSGYDQWGFATKDEAKAELEAYRRQYEAAVLSDSQRVPL